MLLPQLLILVGSAVLVCSLPARTVTEEDAFFHSLSQTEQKALLSLAARLHLQGSPGQVNEIHLPTAIAQHLVKAPENFFPNLVSWISNAWGLTSGETQDLLDKGRSCRGHSCLDFNDISNYCCPFGK